MCNMESFVASCPGEDSVIVMERARYGRMQTGKCIQESYKLGCQSDVTKHLDSLCSGRRECSVKVPDDTIYKHNECSRDVMPYLEASYKCHRGKIISIACCMFEMAFRLTFYR